MTRRLPAPIEARLRERYEVRLNQDDVPLSPALLKAAFAESDAVVATVTDRIDAGVLQGSKTRLLANYGVGVNHIDLSAAAGAGLVVTNTPGVLTDATAELAYTLMLMTARRAGEGERLVRSGKWTGWAPTQLVGRSLDGATLGIVGMGRIGRAIARRLDAFGVPVVYHSRNPQKDVNYKYYSDLVVMAREVNTMMVIVPGGPATKNLINKQVLEALGPDGILINMARGSVVDEPALIEALKSKTIMSAGLDVFVNEPHVPAELIAMDNVVLFPHLGSASEYTRRAMDQLVVDNLLAWFSGKPPLTPVPETPYPPQKRG